MIAPPFVAVDGESVTTDDGDHRYVMVCAADAHGYRRQVERRGGVPAHVAFDFLTGLDGVLVAFAWNYDVTMMLKDLPARILRTLWVDTEVIYHAPNRHSYRIVWIPSRIFEVECFQTGRRATVYDTWGFFQSSFVRALQEYGLTSGEVARMKSDRAHFGLADMPSMRHYAHEECRLLATMMGQLAANLDRAGIRPSGWYGPGAVAGSVLAARKMGPHIIRDRALAGTPDALAAVMSAYFGARIELYRQGELPEAWGYDLRSAYPWAATGLPSLAGASLRPRRTGERIRPGGIYRLDYTSGRATVAPAPHRTRTRAIHWPREGSGWYHYDEAQAMRSAGARFDLGPGYVLEGPGADERPFGWVADTYRARQEARAAGRPDKPYKLVLNSLYGKLAQGYGANGRPPRWQSYYLAGRITAACRARLLEAAADAERAVLWTATDGIGFSERRPLGLGAQLGAWDESRYRDAFLVRPGIYQVTDAADGHAIGRSRGWFVRELDFDALRAAWRRHGPYGSWQYQATRFVGIGTALARGVAPGRWETGPRNLSFYLDRKVYGPWQPGQASVALLAPRHVTDPPEPSYPYEPKGWALDGADLDYLLAFEQPNYEALFAV